MKKTNISAAKKLVLVAALAATIPCIPAYAGSFTSKEFLEYSEGQRAWWFMGAVATASHAVSVTNEKQGECMANWYFENEKKHQQEIEETMRKYTTHLPSSVVLAVLQKNCGKIGQ